MSDPKQQARAELPQTRILITMETVAELAYQVLDSECDLEVQLRVGMTPNLTRFTEVQQTRPLLFRRAPIARSVPQIPFGHLPLAARCKFWELYHRSGNWGTARKDFKAC